MKPVPPTSDVTTDMLHGYVDNQLSPEEREAVEAYLEENPEMATNVADWQRQNDDLRALYANPSDQPQINVAALSAQSSRPRQSTPIWRVAAAIALFVAGGALGFVARPALAPEETQIATVVLNDAFNAHRVYVADPHRPVEVRADEEELLVRWLSTRIGTQLAAPDLNDQGFALVGGRLLPGETGPAALFMYENHLGSRVTVFVSTEQTQEFASFQFESRGNLSSAHWTEDRLQFAVIGELDQSAIRSMAIEVYRQII